jgi:hypothetical protein
LTADKSNFFSLCDFPMALSAHHYVFDVVPLLGDCIDKLQSTIDRDLRGRHDALYELKDVLVATEQTVHQYISHVLAIEQKSLSQNSLPIYNHDVTNNITIMETLATLKQLLEAKQSQESTENRRLTYLNPQDPARQHSYYTARSATDSLLFRLIVALQLCLVRIDDAHFVLSGRRIGAPANHERLDDKRLFMITSCCCVLGAGAAVASLSLGGQKRARLLVSSSREIDQKALLMILAEGGVTLAVGKWIHSMWKTLWMTDKIARSTHEIDDWLAQWQMVKPRSSSTRPFEMPEMSHNRKDTYLPQKEELLDDNSRQLIEYAMKNGPKVSRSSCTILIT